MSGRSDEDECRIVPPIGGLTSNQWRMPRISTIICLKSVEGASNLCDIPSRFDGRIIASMEKGSNDRDINCNRWKK